MAPSDWPPADNRQMTADTEIGICASLLDCVFKRVAVRHDGRAGNDARPIGAHYPGVNPSGESKIICVDDESFH